MTNSLFFNAVYILTNAFRVFTIFKFLTIFFTERNISKKNEIVCYIGYFLINSSLYIFFENPIMNLLNNSVLIFVLAFIYQSSFLKKLAAPFIVYAASLFIESIVYYSITSFNWDRQSTMITVFIVSRIIYYLAVSLFNNFKNLKLNHKISVIYMISIIFTSAFSIYASVIFMLIYNDINNEAINIILCISGLLAINISIVYLYDSLSKRYHEEAENKLLEQQNKFYSKQLDIMNQSQDNIKFLKHDIKYHFNTLKTMIANGESVTEHIDKFLHLINCTGEYAQSGNIIVDSILNYKLQEATNKKAEVELYLKIPRKLNILPFDMGVILGNVLENAITAVSKINGKRKIKISMYFEKNTIYINIENTFDGKLIIGENGYKTTKEDEFNHGFGLQSVRKALKKYNGEIIITSNNNIFNVNILLYNN